MPAFTTRNLTILITDIKGFTDKTSNKSRSEIQQLLDRHNEIVLPVLKGRGGSLVKTMGDAFLMTFESPTDAVLAGIEAQEALRKYNVGKKAADRIDIRVAINQGEVNLSQNDIFGEPVNITARIEAVADAGDVFFTEAIYLAMNKKEVPSSEVGLFQLKGIPEKVRVYRVKREQAGSSLGQISQESAPPTAERPAPPPPPQLEPAPPPSAPRLGKTLALVAVIGGGLAVALFIQNKERAAPASAPGGSPAARFSSRQFPSIFKAWSGPYMKGEDPLAAIAAKARRDLIFSGTYEFKLKWNDAYEGLSEAFTPESLVDGMALRSELLARNPSSVLILEIRYHDANDKYLPPEHDWWERDARGQRVPASPPGFFRLDFRKAGLRDRAAAQCRAAVLSGVVDGCFFNVWEDEPDRLALLKKTRAAIGDAAVILVGSGKEIPQSLPYINGVHIASRQNDAREHWQSMTKSLVWFQTHLREPKMICLENEMPPSADQPKAMRFTTALALTHADGYVLFSTLVDGRRGYDWQVFWDNKLGRPLGFGQPRPDDSMTREFEKGTVVYNPIGNPPTRVRFPQERTSASTGRKGKEFTLAGADGDFYLR